MEITPSLLKAMNHGKAVNDADIVAAKLNAACKKYGINTPLRVLHFLAQLGHESSFKPVEENLNYSAKRLLEVFPKYFRSYEVASAYAFRPAAIASRTYGGRMGNGAESTGEGYLYRGRGYLQLTGKSNYLKYSKLIGYDLVSNPDLCLQHGISALVAAAYFVDRGILPWCDSNNLEAVTLRVNGGYHGIKDRRLRFIAGAKHAGITL